MKAGALVCVDSGEYSDYQVMGFFVALQDFDPMVKLAEYLDKNPEQKEHYKFSQHGFLAFLTGEGLLLDVPYGTLYLSGYGYFGDVSFTPAGQS